MFVDTPGPPAEIVVSNVTEEKCTLTWQPALEDGGDAVMHYVVERRDTNRLNWVVMDAECKGLTCDITRLFKNCEYLFRVRGVNKYGQGPALQSDAIIARNNFSKYIIFLFSSFSMKHKYSAMCIMFFPLVFLLLQLCHHHLEHRKSLLLERTLLPLSG